MIFCRECHNYELLYGCLHKKCFKGRPTPHGMELERISGESDKNKNNTCEDFQEKPTIFTIFNYKSEKINPKIVVFASCGMPNCKPPKRK